MTLGALLDEIRGLYLEQFEGELGAATQHGDISWEEPLRDQAGNVVGDGPFNLPIRLDLVLFQGDVEARSFEKRSIDSARRLSFDPLEFTWGDALRVRVAPFAWDELEVELEDWAGSACWEPLVAWFEKWFARERECAFEQDELLGVIHFLSDPKVEGERGRFVTDLGSAPVECFEELLDAIARTGARRARLGG